MTLRDLYYNYTGYPNVYEGGGFGNFFRGVGRWVKHPFNKTARYNASVQSNPDSYGSGEITNFNTTGNGTTDWGSMGGFATGQTSQNNITNPYQGTTMMEQSFAQTGTPNGETVDGNAFADISKSGKSEGTWTRGGGGVPWGSIISAAGTNIANAFLDTEASTADRVAGALGISALAKQWTADTSKGDAKLKEMQNNLISSAKPNYIQDASSTWGANNAVKLNNKSIISPISSVSGLPSLKDFKGNWWRNMGASVAQGAASGSVGGPWGALGGAVTGLFGSIGGLFGREGRADRAYKDFLAKRNTLVSAQEAAYNRAVKDQTLSNMQALVNGNAQQRINDMANIRAYGGNLYTDLSPNMMSLWNNKQQIDQQKVNMQQMNFGLGNSFNYKNMFPNGGDLVNPNEGLSWYDILFGDSRERYAEGVTEPSYVVKSRGTFGSDIARRAYFAEQAVENARRNRESDIEFWDRYRDDWGDRTPDYANMSEEEFIKASESDDPNFNGLPLSDYNRYKYRKYLNYPKKNTFNNAYLFMPDINELRKKYPLKDLPVYQKNGSWYLKEGVPASNGYKNTESGGHKIPQQFLQDTLDELRRRAWTNEFYDTTYDLGEDLPKRIHFQGNSDVYTMRDDGKYANKNGETWDAGDYNDIRQLLKEGWAKDYEGYRKDYLKHKKEQDEKTKKRQEEGHIDDYWHKETDDNFMTNPIVEHDEIVVTPKSSNSSQNVSKSEKSARQKSYDAFTEDFGGSEGVKNFQEKYNMYHPEAKIKVDGIAGPETVRAFQKWNNEYGSDNVYGLDKLSEDGWYGDKSREYFTSGIAKRNLGYAYGGLMTSPYPKYGEVNKYAEGGSVEYPQGAQYYANGGTHEENPYGGIQVGVDQQGNPNLVEEGEFRWGDYIFSDRINVDPTLLSRYNLAPATKHQGKKANKGKLSYADMAKKYAKKNNELANDPIGKNTLDAYMKRLQDAQEDQKFQDSMEQQKQDAINQYRKTLSTPTQGNPMYGAMKYNGMGNAATQQGVNARMSDLGQQGNGNEVLSNTNRSGNNMLHALGGNLFWRGGRTLNPPPYGDPESRIDYAMSYTGNPIIPNGNSRIDYANQFLQGNQPVNDYGVSDFMNRIYSGNVGYGSPKANTTVAQTQTPQNFQEWALWQHDNGNKPYVGSANTDVEPDAFALQAQGKTADGSTADADYTTGYKGTSNTNTSSSGLTGNINTDNTTTGTYATNAFKEDREGIPLYSTAGKFATFGKGLTPMLYDWMNKTNTKYDPNQRPATELVNMGNNSTFLRTADTIGGYRAPNLMDAERMNNAAQAQGLAALQSALSVGNGNRGFAAAQANQQMYNTGIGIGNNYATAQQANNEERYKTDAYNTAIDQFNANARNASYQDNQKAQQVGQQMALSAKQAANDYLQKENWYADRTNRTAMDNRATNQAAWTDNALNYFITQAQENAERNRQNNDITKRYWSDKDGVMHYIGDSGLNGKIREYFRRNNIDNGTFTGDRLAAFNSIIQNNKAKDVANEKGELWSTVQGLMDDEIAARNKETADADKAKADELQEYRDQFDSELAQLGRYAANKDIYGNYWTSSGDLDYYGKEGFRDSQSLSQLKRAIEMLRTHNDRYNKWTPQNVTAYGGRINNGNKNNKNGYYTYTY